MLTISKSTVKECNEKPINVKNPVGVFIGGTSGIGEHSAYAFVRHTVNPKVYIIGRNPEAGAKVLSELMHIQPHGNYEFIGCDMSLIGEVDKLTAKIKKREKKLNVLSVSCGTFSLTGPKTSEGLDSLQAVYYYGRWRAIDQLIPLVNNAAKKREPARVNFVLAPIGMKAMSNNDLNLQPGSNWATTGIWATRMSNLLVMKYARLYPNVAIMNIYPGIVNTGLVNRGLPAVLHTPMNLAMGLVAENPASCGERMHYYNIASKISGGGHLFGLNGQDMVDSFQGAGYLTRDMQDLAYENLHAVFKSLDL